MFRAGAGWTLLFVALTALFAAAALMTYRVRGWSWVSVGLVLATIVFGLGSVVESLVLRIELTDDAMLVTRLTGRTRYAIADIARISEEKGGPPAIQLRDGRWVKLPSIADNLGNSVRAWLKAAA